MDSKHKRNGCCRGRKISRRDFITNMTAATAGLLVGGLAPKSAFASFAANANSKVAFTNITSYDRPLIRAAVESLLNSLGGLSDIITPGDKVGIKINLTGGTASAVKFQASTGLHPGATYWTHPEILRAIGELVKDAGASEVYVVEAIYDEQSINDFGYTDVMNYLGAEFVDLNGKAPYSDYTERPVGDNNIIFDYLTQNGVLNDFDCFISLAKSKRHEGAGVTHGMKNLVGTLPVPAGIYNAGQSWRKGIHTINANDGNQLSNLCRVVLDLNNATPIKLVINDAIKTVLGGEGPWLQGLQPVNFDTLMASKDPVAADVIGTQVIGFDPAADDLTTPFPDSINYLRRAGELGMGTYNLDDIEVIQTSPTSVKSKQSQNVETFVTLDSYPNPFNIETTFEFKLAQGAYTSLVIYNMLGQQVRKLVGKSLSAGTHKISWNGKSDRGRTVQTGVYVAMIKSSGYTKTLKVALVK